MNAHTHTQSYIIIYEDNGTEEKFFTKRKVFKEDLKELAEVERQTETESSFVPDNWSQVRERTVTTGIWKDGILNSGVCRRAKLLGRSVKVKNSTPAFFLNFNSCPHHTMKQ